MSLSPMAIHRTHMQDLRDVTNNVHYENYRYRKLANVSVTDGKIKDGSKYVYPFRVPLCCHTPCYAKFLDPRCYSSQLCIVLVLLVVLLR